MIIGYERVSTKKQDNSRQERVLEDEGIKLNKIYRDKTTGAIKDRPALNEMLLNVKKGDIVYCESISRLGRNLKDLINIIDTLIAKGVRVKILKEGIDTSNNTYKLLLGIFGAVAEMERETTQERTQQKIDQLKEDKENTGKINTKSGRWFGRQAITKDILDSKKEFVKYYSKILDGSLTRKEVAKILGIGRTTLYEWIKIYEGGTIKRIDRKNRN
ncbi:recombinase family protein [Clostridioides difficile]|uniref:recombinase family protein n=1 Tax=Clostridioides difficile TaxID=1496 RepID=UPI000C9B1CB3|nr:recombinase family protein [Clostridioides difficile]MBY2557788.1 recombinase family protein [Clostridioides difficile]MCH4299910.1 recombinase family protein [Clostridioides difficile]MCI4304770.1 recombinase family protein [Clostridioides difficile]MCM4101574.1 recombinase family protein [Clostridioides difficile]MCP8365779.1 recombinase family protein [Clostridioides difficile]